MRTVERGPWPARVRPVAREVEPGAAERGRIERVAVAMFDWAYPRGLGRHHLFWDDLHAMANGGTGWQIRVGDAQRILRYWRGLARVALRTE